MVCWEDRVVNGEKKRRMSDEPQEADLICQAVAGDRGSLSQLLLLHYDDLVRHVSKHMSPELQGVVLVDDILQQTFVRAAQAIANYEIRGPGAFRAWLKTIAGNLVKDAHKRRRCERRLPQFVRRPAHVHDSTMGALVDRIAGESTSPSGHAYRNDNLRHMRAALAGLPDDQREVIQRHYLQDQSLEQIARAMSRTKDAIRGACYRARKNLRVSMGQSSLYFGG